MTLSYSVFFAVRRMTGSAAVSGRLRRRRRMEMPSSPGSMMSSRMRSGFSFRRAENSAVPSAKPRASMPVFCRV